MLPNGRIPNTFVGNTPLARLTLGITGADGKRAAITFVRDEETKELVADFDPATEWKCCVEGCNKTVDPQNTMYCAEHFFALGKGAGIVHVANDAKDAAQ